MFEVFWPSRRFAGATARRLSHNAQRVRLEGEGEEQQQQEGREEERERRNGLAYKSLGSTLLERID